MIGVPYELSHHEDNNPLDMVEELSEAKDWEYTRMNDQSLIVRVPGQKSHFEIALEWQEEFSALLFSCSMPVEIDIQNKNLAATAMEQINQNVWLGHFDLSNKNTYPTFRHTMLFRMIPSGIAIDIINNVFEIAIAECDRFYTTFQLAQAGDQRINDNLEAMLFKTVGEA